MAEEVIKTTSGCDAMMGGLLGAMANKRELDKTKERSRDGSQT